MSEPSRPPPPAAYVPSKVKPNGAPKSDGNLIDLDDGPPVPPRPPPDAIPVEASTKQLKAKTRAPPPPPAPYSRTHQNTSPTGGGGPPPKPSRPRTVGDAPSHKPPPTSSLPPSRPRLPSGSKQSQPEITVISAEPMTSDIIPPPKKPDESKKDVKKAPPPKPSHPPPPIPPPASTKEQEESESKPDTQKDDDLMKFSPATEKKSENTSPPEEANPPAPKKEAPAKPQRKAPPPKPSHPASAQPKHKEAETDTTQTPKEESSISHSRGSIKKAPPPISGRPKPPPPAPFAKRASVKAKDKTQEEETSSPSTSQSSGSTSPRAPPPSHAAPVPTSNVQEEHPTDDKEPVYAKVVKKPRPPSVVSEAKPSETVSQGSSPPAPSKTPPTSSKQEEEKRKPPPSRPPPTKPPSSVPEPKASPKPVRKAPAPPKSAEKGPQPATKSSPPAKPALDKEAPKPVPQAQPTKPQPQPTKPQPQPTKRGAAPGRPPGGPQKPSKPPPPSTGQPPPKPRPPKPSSMPRTDQPKRPTPAKRTTVAQDEPPPLPPRPVPGHPLYKYVCPDPHGIATTNKEPTFESELSYMQGDVIVLIEKVDEYWYWACNCDNDNEEGVVLGSNLKIVKRLPGSDTVAGFDDGPCAVAMNNYEGLRDDELTFKEGDLIMLKAHVGSDWFRGQLVNGVVGIFPKSFVEVVEELPPGAVEPSPPPPTPPPLSPDITPSGPYCIAIETFSGETAGDLSFASGDIIELVERIDDNWLRGSLNGQTGMFPQSFVDIRVDIKVGVVSSAAISDNENMVTALYDYDVGEEGDLIFKANDKITVLSKVNDEWVYGKLNGKEGQFPVTFVDRLPPNLPNKTSASAEASEQPKEKKATATGECNALYDFETDAPGELAFVAGETIITTEKINDDWLYGKIGDREGIFPLSLVKVVKELVQPSATNQKSSSEPKKKLGGEDASLLPKGVAISDFEPGSSAEIQLKTGDSVFLLTREDQQWYMGENQRTGEIGNFPISFIDVITPLP